MADPEGITMEQFRVLLDRVGIKPTAEEIDELKSAYELHLKQIAALHELDLGPEDLAVAFSPVWDEFGGVMR